MSQCLVKLPHTCGSSDALQVFEDDDGKVTGYCFACKTYVPDPMGEGFKASDIPVEKRVKKTPEEIEAEMQMISELGTVDLVDRRLRKDALEYYGVKVGFSEEDGKTPKFVHFPYTKDGRVVKYKTRILNPKKMWSIYTEKETDLFGWEQAKGSGAKRLIITEGEFDAVALKRILDINTPSEYAGNIPAIVSVTNGAGGAVKEITKNIKEIREHFKDISICFDKDEVGQKAVEEVCKKFPDFKVINLPQKDANECLINGLGKAAYKAVTFNAEKKKNSRLVWGREIHEAAKEQAQWGLSYPWKKLTEMTRGIRFGETIYIAAAPKMGKSEVVNTLGEHLITVHGLKIMMAKPEEANKKTYKLMLGKAAGKIFHDPKVEFDEEAYDKAGERIKDNLVMLDLYQDITWSTTKQDIRDAAEAGVKVAFIDPVTNFTNGMSSSEINEFLQGFSQEAAVLAKDLDIAIFLFCHTNKQAKGSTPFDRGGKITLDDFAGSSAMARSCNYAMAIQGNKDSELSLNERNMREIVILADREFGESGSQKLYWDWQTGLFNEVD